MSGVRINSNLSSLRAQRLLSEANKSLSTAFERLSSGLRINRASDDAAGLSISSRLEADGRVYGQAIRNLNDGISTLNIAQGALSELSGIGTRIKELAEQAANGVYTWTQRKALNAEGTSLVDEFNRIVGSVSFNGMHILDRSTTSTSYQGGYGSSGMLSIGLGEELMRTAGTGTFGPRSTGTMSAVFYGAISCDMNSDGIADICEIDDGQIDLMYGNGSGGFTAGPSYAVTAVDRLISGDFNGDGKTDLVYTDGSGSFYTRLNNGSGGLSAATMASGYSDLYAAGDLNHDGRDDLVAVANVPSSRVVSLLSRGDGTFSSTATIVMGSPDGGVVGDFNADGNLDFVGVSIGAKTVSMYLGNGVGAFSFASSYSMGSVSSVLATGDYNNDGAIDLAMGVSGITVLTSNGANGFSASNSYSIAGGASYVVSADFNGDGIPDIAGSSGSTMGVILNNGSGSFSSGGSYALTGINFSLMTGDLNGDGVNDLFTAEPSPSVYGIYLGRTFETTGIAYQNLGSKEGALSALDEIDDVLDRIAAELGSIGAFQSRLETALQNLMTARENFASARSRIVDADIAAETANLNRLQILQQAGSAVLAQANVQPRLALLLLEGINGV